MKKPVTAKKTTKTAPQHGHQAKTPHHKAQHVPAQQRIARHKAAQKAARTRAKNAKKARKHPARKLALAEGVACCAAEALAASLRLAGRPVSDEDVLELYWRTASDPDAGASILATLKAASWHGLAGVRPVSIRNVDSSLMSDLDGGPMLSLARPLTCGDGNAFMHSSRSRGGPAGALVGLMLPGGPHALTLDPSGLVWSWGELHDPAELGAGLIEEAWLVDWEV